MRCGRGGTSVRLVLDTNIIISGLLWGGKPLQVLELAKSGQAELFTSSPLLAELLDALRREKFAALLASQRTTPAFLMQRYELLTRFTFPEPIERTVRDADDDLVIATALAASADAIVSGDKDLLVLHPYKGVDILNAAAALARLQELQ